MDPDKLMDMMGGLGFGGNQESKLASDKGLKHKITAQFKLYDENGVAIKTNFRMVYLTTKNMVNSTEERRKRKIKRKKVEEKGNWKNQNLMVKPE